MDKGSGNNHKPNDDFVIAIRELRFVMRFLGIWQRPDSPKWYKLVWYIQSFCIAFIIFGPTAGLIVNRHDSAKTVGNLVLAIPTAMTFFEWMIHAVHSRTNRKLCELMEKHWINLEESDSISASVPESRQIMTRYYRTARIFFLTYVSIMATGVAKCILDSVLLMDQRNGVTDYDQGIFPIPYSWYPVNFEQGYSYQIAFVAQAITVVIAMFMRATIENFIITVISDLCAQFEILRHFTESITYDSSRPGHCEAQVRRMIRRHQELLEAAEKLQKSFSAIIGGHYVSGALTICFFEYAIIAEMEKTDPSFAAILDSAFFCGSFLQLMFLLCSFGERLTNQSVAVAEAVYNSDWYNCQRSVRLSLLTSLARAQRPVIINGAGLIPISLGSFTNLIKASASYLSVLRAVGVTDGDG